MYLKVLNYIFVSFSLLVVIAIGSVLLHGCLTSFLNNLLLPLMLICLELERNESLESGPTEPSIESWSNRLPSSIVDNISPCKSNQVSPKKVEASPIKVHL